MKAVLKVIFLIGFFTAQVGFAATCKIDKSQMHDQISQYGSISTTGCPLNAYGWGIVSVKKEGNSSGRCSATCKYAIGPGSNGVPCTWEKGNWGDTLTCH